jgi:hypothetical protein
MKVFLRHPQNSMLAMKNPAIKILHRRTYAYLAVISLVGCSSAEPASVSYSRINLIEITIG